VIGAELLGGGLGLELAVEVFVEGDVQVNHPVSNTVFNLPH
jgi:hypothetical protein